MPTPSGLHLPRRYNSLRLLGFDYSSKTAFYSITIDTDSSRPVFGDIGLAKTVLSTLLNERTGEQLTVSAYTLLPDHLHFIVRLSDAPSLSTAIGAFKSYTTQIYWKRSKEIVELQSVTLPPRSVERADKAEARMLLDALVDWKATLRPEMVELKNWPHVAPQHFQSKQLWHDSFHDHVIRNDADLRESVEYIAMNPVKRGYVSRPEYYPFTGFCFGDVERSVVGGGY